MHGGQDDCTIAARILFVRCRGAAILLILLALGPVAWGSSDSATYTSAPFSRRHGEFRPVRNGVGPHECRAYPGWSGRPGDRRAVEHRDPVAGRAAGRAAGAAAQHTERHLSHATRSTGSRRLRLAGVSLDTGRDPETAPGTGPGSPPSRRSRRCES